MTLVKNIITIIFLFAFLQVGYGQVEYLRLSPSQKIEQRIGTTDVNIEFSRPQMKGREIFGALVPYDEMWRTGANENTTISFSHRVRIGETEVAEGVYALFTKPKLNEWDIYFYKDINNLDVPNPIDSTKLIYLTTVESFDLPFSEETLVINIYDITETSAKLGISWGRTGVRIPIEFYTKEAMEKMIAKEFQQNIFDYSIAASYYQQRGIELEKAKKLQALAMELKEAPTAWDYYSYGTILHKLGNEKEALSNLELSLKIAHQAQDEYLIKELGSLITKIKAGLGK